MNLADAKKYSKYLHITIHKGIYIKKKVSMFRFKLLYVKTALSL